MTMALKMGDFFDRLTILRMKARLDKSARDELEKYMEELERITAQDTWKEHINELLPWVLQLAEANAKTWIKEASIRKEYQNDSSGQEDLSLAEIGRRALEIRGYNKLRIEAKNKIDAVYGDLPDMKVDHASAGPGTVVTSPPPPKGTPPKEFSLRVSVGNVTRENLSLEVNPPLVVYAQPHADGMIGYDPYFNAHFFGSDEDELRKEIEEEILIRWNIYADADLEDYKERRQKETLMARVRRANVP